MKQLFRSVSMNLITSSENARKKGAPHYEDEIRQKDECRYQDSAWVYEGASV
jgi:hypothetical protein